MVLRIKESILKFWFGEEKETSDVIKSKQNLWWGKDELNDQSIKDQFEPALSAEIRGELNWETAQGFLARILLLDQFSRNMYRGASRAFEYDSKARSLSERVIKQNLHQPLRLVEKVFIYFPFEHSEDNADQDKSFQLFQELWEKAPNEQKEPFLNFFNFAKAHKEIIDRFGRFPHRNAILGRKSTLDEIEFLKKEGSSF